MSTYSVEFHIIRKKMYIDLEMWSKSKTFKEVPNILIDTGSPYTLISNTDLTNIEYNRLGINCSCNGIGGKPFKEDIIEQMPRILADN